MIEEYEEYYCLLCGMSLCDCATIRTRWLSWNHYSWREEYESSFFLKTRWPALWAVLMKNWITG